MVDTYPKKYFTLIYWFKGKLKIDILIIYWNEKQFNFYCSLENEGLFAVKPTYIERWKYIDGLPYMEIFNVEKQEYEFTKYEGGITSNLSNWIRNIQTAMRLCVAVFQLFMI